MTPPARPDLPDVILPGLGAVTFGATALVSPFMTARIWESSPLWIFVTGVLLGSISIWLAVQALKAPKKSPGRGAAGVGIALALIGMAFCAFGAIVQSMLISDGLL